MEYWFETLIIFIGALVSALLTSIVVIQKQSKASMEKRIDELTSLYTMSIEEVAGIKDEYIEMTRLVHSMNEKVNRNGQDIQRLWKKANDNG